MAEKGKLIVLEGIDGSGKATQVKHLGQALEQSGIKTQTLHFPQYTTSFMGGYVGKMLHGDFGQLDELNPYLIAPMYGLDRFEAKPIIESALNDGTWFLLDRYSPSNFHQAAKIPKGPEREEFIGYFETLEYWKLKLPKEDVVLFLYVLPSLAQKLVDKKSAREYVKGSKRDIAESDLAHLEAASQVYSEIAEIRQHWSRINCMEGHEIKSEMKIHEMIVIELKLRGMWP